MKNRSDKCTTGVKTFALNALHCSACSPRSPYIAYPGKNPYINSYSGEQTQMKNLLEHSVFVIFTAPTSEVHNISEDCLQFMAPFNKEI